jgi:predicted hotdog family 3-hydroxylacyl-ACP dehydratase
MNILEKIAIVEGEDILKFLPQQPPFTMLDTLFYCDEKKAISGLMVSAENILVANGLLQEPGILENIAQTIALKAGYQAAEANLKPSIGFIVSIKEFKLNCLVPIAEMLITEVEIKMVFQNMLIVTGNSYYNDIQVASCEMNLFIQQ